MSSLEWSAGTAVCPDLRVVQDLLLTENEFLLLLTQKMWTKQMNETFCGVAARHCICSSDKMIYVWKCILGVKLTFFP